MQVFEDDREIDVGELIRAEFGDEGGLGLFLEDFYGGAASGFFLAEDGGGKALGGHDTLDDGAGFGGGADEVKGGFGFADEGNEFLDRGDDGLNGLLAVGEGLDETLFADLVGGALDHEHVFLGAHVDEIQGAGGHLVEVRVGHELAVDLGDAHAGDGAGPRNVGDGEGGGRAVDHGDVGVVDLVGGEELADDLDLVKKTLGEEGAAGAVAEAGGEDFLFGGTALALEVAAGEAAGSGVFLAVIHGKGEEVLTGFYRGGNAGGDEEVGLADGDIDRAIGKGGVGAGGEGDPEGGNGDGVLLN